MNPRIQHFRPTPIFACMFVALWLVGCANQETGTGIDNSAVVPDEPAASETAFHQHGRRGRIFGRARGDIRS